MRRLTSIAAAGALLIALAGCAGGGAGSGGDGGGDGGGEMIVGFAQVGAESGWRTANTVSVQETFAEAGIELKFSDGQGKQENQIKAIRSFIQQQVDIIILSPVVDTGWDTVLTEAKDAGIPVILSGRGVDSPDELWATFLGADFVIEGEKAGNWAVEEFADADSVKVVELFGTTGSTPANDRAEGFLNIVGGDPKFEIIASQTGDFTRAGGKQVMEAFLQSNPEIDLVYAHNDDMGLGAVEAIEAAGLAAGRRHQTHHGRRGEGRHGRAVGGQAQLHRRVLAAARTPAARDRHDAVRWRNSRPAHHHGGDYVHAGAGHRGPARPHVLS